MADVVLADRRRHDRRPHGGGRHRRREPRASPTASSRSTSPARAGSSTTPTRSGASVQDTLGEVVAALEHDGDRSSPSASPTSARPWSSGTVAPGGRGTGPSCGRTGARRHAATSCAPPASSRSCGRAPASCSTRTSPRPSSSGCSTRAASTPTPHLAFGTVDSWVLWNLTGEHATEPSNASRTMLFDIDAARRGRTSSSTSSASPARACPRCDRAAGASASPIPTRAAGLPCRSRGSPATSKRRCSARPASPRA